MGSAEDFYGESREFSGKIGDPAFLVLVYSCGEVSLGFWLRLPTIRIASCSAVDQYYDGNLVSFPDPPHMPRRKIRER